MQIKPIQLLFLTSCYAFGAATLSISLPPYLSNCPNGFVTATLAWSGATGQVQIRVLSATGPAMNGFTNPTGTATTGPWVTNGLPFFLVDQTGAVQATATANFSCGGTPRTIDQGLSGGSYFPLAVGNTWVYRSKDRISTNDYSVWTITGTQVLGGLTYYTLQLTYPAPPPPQIEILALLRVDANGAIYRKTDHGDLIYLDPNASDNQHVSYSGPLGTLADAIQPVETDPYLKTTATYARGIGLVSTISYLIAGSSGGFSNSLELVDVQVDGIHLSIPAPKISLSIENTDLDLTNQLVPNCAVPCYFPACGTGGGDDPPGLYRPCAQIRIDTTANASGYAVLTQLLDSTNTAVFENTTPVGTLSSLAYLRVPLYTSPNYGKPVPLPAGDYTLTGSILNGTTTQAMSSITVHIH